MGGETPSGKSNSRKMLKDCIMNTVGVSNATNSRSPMDLRSRVFVGNLNTSVITKKHLHLIFQQHGEIKAISMHKGYAFVQYADEMDALNAVYSQDRQMIAGQPIDVNIVTEPKPHQKASNRNSGGEQPSGGSLCQEDNHFLELKDGVSIKLSAIEQDASKDELNVVKVDEKQALKFASTNTNDVETDRAAEYRLLRDIQGPQVYHGNLLSGDETMGESETVTHRFTSSPMSKLTDRTDNGTSTATSSKTSGDSFSSSKRLRLEIGNSLCPFPQNEPKFDIMICGNCKSLFTSLTDFVQHKSRGKCRLRFVCRCNNS